MAKLSTSRKVVIVAIFSGLSFAGGLIKLGTPVGSVALDSWSGFFVAAFYSVPLGGIVAALGHIFSAASGGFPLQELHILVAFLQAIWAIVFGLIIRRINRTWALLLAGAVAVGLNGVVAPLILIPVKPQLASLFKSLIPLLSVATLINIAVASVGLLALSRFRGENI
jgi:hypothetical protein